MFVVFYGSFQLYQFQEDYELALIGYDRAEALDPTFSEAKEKKKDLINYLNCLTNMVETKVFSFSSQFLQCGILLFVYQLRWKCSGCSELSLYSMAYLSPKWQIFRCFIFEQLLSFFARS